MLLVTVEQDGGIKIFSLVSLESQPVSNFVDETIILKQATIVLTEYVNIFVEKKSGLYWQPTINKFRNDSRRPTEIFLNFYWYIITTENSHHSGTSDSTSLLFVSFSEDLLFDVFNRKLLTLNTLYWLRFANYQQEGNIYEYLQFPIWSSTFSSQYYHFSLFNYNSKPAQSQSLIPQFFEILCLIPQF